MNIWHNVSPERIKPEKFVACIEIPKGSKNKYELDKETGALRLDRILFTSTHYPQNYGFIPLTYAGDNDPLDVLILCSEYITPLALVECYPIGVVKMIDNGEYDEKIIAICAHDPFYNMYKDLKDLPQHISEEIKHFFAVYKTLEYKDTIVNEIEGRQEAIRVIKKCIENYQNKFGGK